MNLFETKAALELLDQVSREYSAVQAKIRHPREKIGDTLLVWLRRIFSILSIIFFIIETIIQRKQRYNSYGLNLIGKIFGTVDYLFVAIVLSTFIAISLLIMYYIVKSFILFINHIRYNSKIGRIEKEKYINMKERLLNRYNTISAQLETSEVPCDYRNLNAINWMINAFVNKRGETYTQLINLYEQHLQNERQNAYAGRS